MKLAPPRRPESLVTLEGGFDDPDGLGQPPERANARAGDDDGWDLDAPEVPGGRIADSD